MCKVTYRNYKGIESTVEVKRGTTIKATLKRAKAEIRKVASTVTIDTIDGIPLISLFPTAASYIDACTL
jgi:hypothetical protein